MTYTYHFNSLRGKMITITLNISKYIQKSMCNWNATTMLTICRFISNQKCIFKNWRICNTWKPFYLIASTFVAARDDAVDYIHNSHNAPPHIPQCTIQNRNVYIYVLYGALWEMGQVRWGFCEISLLSSQPREGTTLGYWQSKHRTAHLNYSMIPFLIH